MGTPRVSIRFSAAAARGNRLRRVGLKRWLNSAVATPAPGLEQRAQDRRPENVSPHAGAVDKEHGSLCRAPQSAVASSDMNQVEEPTVAGVEMVQIIGLWSSPPTLSPGPWQFPRKF